MAWKSVRKGVNGDKSPPVPENNRNGLEQSPYKPVEQAENHEKGPRGSWAKTDTTFPIRRKPA